jgi:deoxyadenosine/deoxycytidine kinase
MLDSSNARFPLGRAFDGPIPALSGARNAHYGKSCSRRASRVKRGARRGRGLLSARGPWARVVYHGAPFVTSPAVPLSKYHYIVVEGPIGVGKTSLAKRLAGRLRSTLVLERPEQNPFLPRFYQDMSRFALPTQLFFLFQRIGQLRELAQMDLFNRLTVCDFLLEKDPLFARLTLSGDELHLYQQIFDALRPQAPRPDLVIYLQAQPSTLYERVRRRGVEFERPISAEYLALLADSYNRFFYHFSGSPVLIVNSERLDFVSEDRDLDLLIERVGAMRGTREFFNWGE